MIEFIQVIGPPSTNLPLLSRNNEKIPEDDSALDLGVEVGLLKLFIILSADLPDNGVTKDEEIFETLS